MCIRFKLLIGIILLLIGTLSYSSLSAQHLIELSGIVVNELGDPINNVNIYLGESYKYTTTDGEGKFWIQVDSVIMNSGMVIFKAPYYRDKIIPLGNLESPIILNLDENKSDEIDFTYIIQADRIIKINEINPSKISYITNYTLRRVTARYFPYQERLSQHYISKVIVYCFTDGKTYPFDLNIFRYDTLNGCPGDKIMPTIEVQTSRDYINIKKYRGAFSKAWIAEVDLSEYNLSIPQEGLFVSPLAQFWNVEIDNMRRWPNNKYEDYYPGFWNHFDEKDDVYELLPFSKGWKKRNKRFSPDKYDENPPFVNLAITLIMVKQGTLDFY